MMFQPFEIFKPQYIDRLIKLNKRYLVSQSYKQQPDPLEVHRISLLFTDFDHLGTAQIHYSAVKEDQYASIIDLLNIGHKGTVVGILGPHSKYRVYWAIVKNINDVQKRLNLRYKDHIRRYLEQNTNWRMGSNEKVNPSLQIVFGELFIVLRRGSQTLRVKFEEIEG